MRYKTFALSVPCDEAAEAELNGFLASHRILNVTHSVVPRPDGACLLFVVEYLPGEGAADKRRADPERIDYREKLSPEDFEVFRRLRELRKQLADEEKLPVYNVFTNAQLAEMVVKRVTTKAGLESIEGVGEARVAKYGERVLHLCAELMKPAETEATPDAPDGKPV